MDIESAENKMDIESAESWPGSNLTSFIWPDLILAKQRQPGERVNSHAVDNH